MRNAVIVLSITVALLVGCIVGAVSTNFVVPPAKAGVKVQKWEYFCFQETDVQAIRKKANQAGAVGFEMSGSAGGVGGQGWGTQRFAYWCFKRRLP